MPLPPAIELLHDAINSHDPARVADCFTDDYACDVPLHPARGFTGREHVLRNYQTLFARVPDLRATVLRCAGDETSLWSEWEMAGTCTDGTPYRNAGVVIMSSFAGERIQAVRFYIDDVDRAGE